MHAKQTPAPTKHGAQDTDFVYGGKSTAWSIAQALGGSISNGKGGFLCHCPVPTHGKGRGDRTPSLSIADGDKRLLVRCFAGCDPRDVLAELRSRGLLDDQRPNGGAKPNGAKAAKLPARGCPPKDDEFYYLSSKSRNRCASH